MDTKTKSILSVVRSEHPRSSVIPLESWPDWLTTSPWRPSFVLSENKRFLAVAVEWSGTVPRFIYRNVVHKQLLKKHKDLSVMVCIPADRVEQDQELATFCQEIKVDLRAVIPCIGTEEISMPLPSLPPKVQARGQTSAQQKKRGQPRVHAEVLETDGQFPRPILDGVRNLPRLCFNQILTSFANKISRCAGNDKAALALVRRTIDELLQSHPFFRVTSASFIRLENFEHLLNRIGGDTSDHVFHSFRVFLAGCPIVDRFYDQIQSNQCGVAICSDQDLRVEYSWLLASLFHDIGRVREGVRELVVQVEGDEFTEIVGSSARWSHPDYQLARRMLGSLGAYVAGGETAGWDGGALDDERGVELTGAWIELYNTYSRHGVISAFDLLVDALKTMTAAGERKYRAFTVSHVVPAALAILLHDWRIWEQAKNWGLFPVDVKNNPLAALLIYLDTWDDFKRRGGSPPIIIADYVIDDSGAAVTVKWPSDDALEKEKRKYHSFSKALIGGPPFFKITPCVRRQ